MKTKQQRKKKDVLAGRDPTMQLYRAIRRYVESLGGSILIIGGIEIQEWPGERATQYRVAVKCLGRRPSPKAADVSNDEAKNHENHS